MPEFKRGPSTGRPREERPPQPDRKRTEPMQKSTIDEELSINDLHIQEELMSQAPLMRKYTKELGRIERKAKAIKNQLEITEGKLYMTLSNDGKGRKVAEIESMVIQDPGVQKLRLELYDAEQEVTEYEGIVKAVVQKLEALKELSWNSRREMV